MQQAPRSIVIGGEAGQGLVTIGDMLVRTLIRSGYGVLVAQHYMSRVRGGHNTYNIRVGAGDVLAPTDDVHVLVALDQRTVTEQGPRLGDGLLILDERLDPGSLNALRVPFAALAGRPLYENIAALGTGTPIRQSGTVLLTGEQAVGYARIRKIDSDNMRAQRQRNVLNAIFEQMKGKSSLEYAEFIRQLLPNVETSLDYGDLMGLATIMFGSVTMEEMSFPNENSNARGGIFYSDGAWYYEYDLDVASQQLHQFIYEDE